MIAEPHAESKATSATMPNLMSNPVPTLSRPRADPVPNPVPKTRFAVIRDKADRGEPSVSKQKIFSV